MCCDEYLPTFLLSSAASSLFWSSSRDTSLLGGEGSSGGWLLSLDWSGSFRITSNDWPDRRLLMPFTSRSDNPVHTKTIKHKLVRWQQIKLLHMDVQYFVRQTDRHADLHTGRGCWDVAVCRNRSRAETAWTSPWSCLCRLLEREIKDGKY